LVSEVRPPLKFRPGPAATSPPPLLRHWGSVIIVVKQCLRAKIATDIYVSKTSYAGRCYKSRTARLKVVV